MSLYVKIIEKSIASKSSCWLLKNLWGILYNMKTFDIKYFTKNISVAVGIILIWRGVWIILDLFDKLIFGGNHIITAIVGIVAGIAMLYLPEKNLKSLERL